MIFGNDPKIVLIGNFRGRIKFFYTVGGGKVTRKVCILGQKSKSEFFLTDSLQAFFKMLTHRGKIIFLQKKGLYEACSIPHSELSKVTLQIIFYF